MTSIGEQYDRNCAVHAYTQARAALAETWRNRHVPPPLWTGRYLTRDYAFWRAVNLSRVRMCRAEVMRTEALVVAIMAPERVQVLLAAE